MAMMTTPAPIVRSPTSKKQLDSAAMQRYKDETQYYIDAKGEKVMPMSWQGEAARALWLTDKPITPKAFERMLDGKDPRNGASLTKKAGTTGRNKLGWDCVNNADKTFSLTLALAEPAERDRLIAAMQRANAASIKHLESRLTIRTGKEGNLEPVKGLAVASMVHLGSRELDPHAHCHNVIMAAGMRADGSFGNLDEAELRRFTKEAGMVFQAELCRELVALNYAVERDPKNEWSTRIVGYTDEQIDAFKERWERELRANDLIRFKENNSKLGVENGLAARIESIRELRDGSHQITAKLPRGKAVSFNTRDYAAIEWGYSSTSIGSQGKTVELAFALVEPQQERSTAAYVEASRSKGDTHLYCTSEDRPQLAAAMSQEDKRGWTVDFLDRNFLDRGLILTKDKAELCKRTGRSWTELATPAPGREADARAAIEAQLKREAAAQPAAQDQPKRDAAAQKPARPWTAEEIALARSVSPERAARAEQAAKEYLERKAAQEHLQREAERARGHFKPEPERQRASISFSR
ncbi:MobF family relaxase [Cupriavidus metallidurans]|uniref:MobF family relaxase n=1 Tax=Cupriavidus metallidurans TaxID=119219 RepID=UPI000786DC9E|nr:MobF family relaxase [Cupriavidus metallidurans]